MVDDIVVEFGNSLYQHTIDAFIAGQPVADHDVRKVWRNTTQSPWETWDEPMYEQVYRTVPAATWALPPKQRMRALLGDPPIDWAKIKNRSEFLFWERKHGPVFWAPLVEKEVLANGRRALLNFGADAFIGVNKTVGGERIHRIVDLSPRLEISGGWPRDIPATPDTRSSQPPAPGSQQSTRAWSSTPQSPPDPTPRCASGGTARDPSSRSARTSAASGSDR